MAGLGVDRTVEARSPGWYNRGMEREEMARLVRERRAGYEAFHRKEIELARLETFEDRLDGMRQVLSFGEWLSSRFPDRVEEEPLFGALSRLRRRYGR